MVGNFLRRRSTPAEKGYAISELIVASSIFCSISMGLLMGFTSLERNYAATTDFTTFAVVTPKSPARSRFTFTSMVG